MTTTGHVLITGGAGFIGSHLTDLLIGDGYEVTVIDLLASQVHRDTFDTDGWPMYINRAAHFIRGGVGAPFIIGNALSPDITHLVHLAASVGVGQSMANIVSYTWNNTLATAFMLDAIAHKGRHLKRIVVASSMSVYGEGNGELPTPETHPLNPASIYAINKRDQEEMCLVMGRALGIPTTALRLFNTYGSRQALGNPYTGVVANFSTRLANSERPIVFDDGQQTRDFIHVSDVARAFLAALMDESPRCDVYNVGTGTQTTIQNLARMLAQVMGVPIEPEITGRHRAGDIRHCVADCTKMERCLGWHAEMPLCDGLAELAAWSQEQKATDRTADSMLELFTNGLLS